MDGEPQAPPPNVLGQLTVTAGIEVTRGGEPVPADDDADEETP